MARRVLIMVIFRVVCICIAMLYQLLAILIGFKAMPLLPFIVLACITSGLSWFYMYVLINPRLSSRTLSLLVMGQFVVDIFSISVLVWFTGGIGSFFSFGYLIIILLSAVFLPKLGIYMFTVLSFGTFYLTSTGMGSLFPVNGGYPLRDYPGEMAYAFAAQFVVFFMIALISAFLQGTYRFNKFDFQKQERDISLLLEMRRRIVEGMHSGLITANGEGVVAYVNQTGASLLRRKAEELVSQSIYDLFWADLIEGPKDTWPKRSERWVDFSDHRRLFGVSISSIELEEGLMGYLVIFQDLTEIKLLEHQKQFTDKMASIGKLSAGVAHEIRNPLASISGSIQVLKEIAIEDVAAQELLSIVDKESQRLNGIVTDFLEYARPWKHIEMKTLDIVDCFKHVQKLAENDEDIRRIKLDVRGESDKHFVVGDEAKIQQIFWNLIKNSSQASQDQDVVSVRFEDAYHDIKIEIEDHGVGMNASQLNDLFTPFQSFNHKGTGLGMSVVYEIIKLHHGKIRANSTPEKGTVMTLLLPKSEGI